MDIQPRTLSMIQFKYPLLKLWLMAAAVLRLFKNVDEDGWRSDESFEVAHRPTNHREMNSRDRNREKRDFSTLKFSHETGIERSKF